APTPGPTGPSGTDDGAQTWQQLRRSWIAWRYTNPLRKPLPISKTVSRPTGRAYTGERVAAAVLVNLTIVGVVQDQKGFVV
ncbi:MAG TPA: hypothetical protein VNS22_00070, partial [Geminicoccus sp.]|uniref:hypothetical protein n=1 Tax=Geminicoccus sp. TaxID=2024832 RepID=UPI002C4C9CD0